MVKTQMSYYDNVKDSVSNKGEKNQTSGAAPSFDTLKEAAEENDDEEEEKADDTPIEVLEEGGLKQQKSSSKSQNNNNQNQAPSQPQTAKQDSNIEEKLDKLIEQNEEIIEVLKSFTN